MSLFSELKHRNVHRMAVLYLAAGWLAMQVLDVLDGQLPVPDWIGSAVLAVLAVGLPIALAISWFYVLTPEGISLDTDEELAKPATGFTGRRVDFVIISVLAAAVLVFAYDKWWLRDGTDATSYTNSVAVLAFADLSPDGDHGWFSAGLSEEIINSLAQLPELKVTARTSAFHFKGLDLPIPEIAATLGVAHVVEGSVRRAGDRMKITVQLIKAVDGFHLWSETYDRDTDDVFAVQEDIAVNIASALDIYLDEERREEMFQTGTRNVQAYEAFLRGLRLNHEWHDNRRAKGLMWEAQRWFERALEYDPEFAQAHYYHGDAYRHYGVGQTEELPPDANAGFTPEAALDLLFRDYDRAIEFAHNEELRVLYQAERTLIGDDWSGFRSLLDKLGTIRETSTNPIILQFNQSDTAFALLGRAGVESNYRHYLKCFEVHPMDHFVREVAVLHAVNLGKYDDALELIERIQKVDSAQAAGSRRLVLFETGHYDEYLADPDSSPAGRALALVASGRHDEARAQIEESLSAAEQLLQSPGTGEEIYALSLLLRAKQLLGETRLAEEFYRSYDSRPVLSTEALTLLIYAMGGRLLWDLEWTPNYAARLAELGVELEPYELPPPAE